MKDKPRFHITYDVIIYSSRGEPQYRGFLPRSGEVPRNRNNMPKKPALFSLRQATEIVVSNKHRIEADSCPVYVPRWLTAYTVERPDDFRNGEGNDVCLSLHLEHACSPSSARRIARLFNTYGMK